MVDTGIVFHSFTVTPPIANFNQTVTVTWNVTGATTLRLSAYADPQHGGDMPFDMPNAQLPIGSYQYTIPYTVPHGILATFTFYLVAGRSDGRIVYSPPFNVTVPCPYTFLAQHPPIAGTETTCFFDAPKTISGLTQSFEHGRMIGYTENGHNMILVMLNGYSRQEMSTTWGDASLLESQTGPSQSTQHPPAGLFMPGDVFGKRWDESAQDLGWALQPPQAYSLTIQSGGDGYESYTWWISLPDGNFIRTDKQHWGTFVKPVDASVPSRKQSRDSEF
jgi:hypothetical protein